jgi:hypothetical protein
VPGRPRNRLRRGFHAFVRAIQEYYGDERLHQFVRAVDAVVMPRIGRSRRDFIYRCQLFAGQSREARHVLENLYDLRSNAEHLNAPDGALRGDSAREREAVAFKRFYQAQALSMHVYDRIFSSPALLAAFATDEGTRQFWDNTFPDQARLWAPPR